MGTSRTSTQQLDPSKQKIEIEEVTPEIPAVRYDIDRMNLALEGPEVILPDGLSTDEILAFLDQAAAGVQ